MKKSLRGTGSRLDVTNPLSWPTGGKANAFSLKQPPLVGQEFLARVEADAARNNANMPSDEGKDDAHKQEVRFWRQKHALTEQCNFLQTRSMVRTTPTLSSSICHHSCPPRCVIELVLVAF
jgi:hypothetical protein